MKPGSSYDSLDKALRCCVAAAMTYYDVDSNNKRFINILNNIVSDVKEGKNLTAEH